MRLVKFLDAGTKSLTTDPGLSKLKDLVRLAQEVRGIGLGNVQFFTVPFQAYAPDPNRLALGPVGDPALGRSCGPTGRSSREFTDEAAKASAGRAGQQHRRQGRQAEPAAPTQTAEAARQRPLRLTHPASSDREWNIALPIGRGLRQVRRGARRERVDRGEVELAVVGADALDDLGGGGVAEDGGLLRRTPVGDAEQEAGAERVAAAGGVDDVDLEGGHPGGALGAWRRARRRRPQVTATQPTPLRQQRCRRGLEGRRRR